MSITARCAVVATATTLLASTIAYGGFPDCNANGVDDAIDIGSGTSADDNANTIPDECEATVLYVDVAAGGPVFTGTSWDTAYTDLQDALAVARVAGNAAEQIWIAAGTYLPDGGTIDRAASFDLIDGVALYGGFDGTEVALGDRDPDANLTTLSGDLGAPADASDNSFHIITSTNVGPSALVDGVTISGGNANGGGEAAVGGGAYLIDSTPTFNDCRIADNAASGSGGGIYAVKSAVTPTSLTISDCIVENNSAAVNGGAMVGFFVSITISNSQFLSNTADETGNVGSGGGLWLLSALLFADGTSFTGNNAGFGGGAIAAGAGAKIVLTDCQLDVNAASRGGGFWVFGDSAAALTICTLTGNTASVSGGGADVEDSSGTFNSCTFDANRSTQLGGAIHASLGTELRSRFCTFDGNTGGDGGAINSDSGAVTGVIGSTFVGNRAATGGAMRTEAATNGVVNSSFFANIATSAGAAVTDDAASTAYNNCIFAGNSSDGPAGTVHVINAATTIVANCTVTVNSATTGGGVLVDGGTANVANSILWLNTDDGGTNEAAQAAALSGTLTVDWCDVQGLTGGLGGSGNIDVNPRFVDPTGGDTQPGTGDEDYSLRDASPCIDAADNALVQPDFLDVDGDGDFLEPTPLDHDGNTRIVDDPAVADTGPSAAPVVDMGAVEFQDTSCPQDVDNDDFIGFSDLTTLLAAWGPCNRCVEDIDRDDLVGFSDLTSMLNAWGDCP